MDQTFEHPKLMFIGGADRSGTSLLQKILNGHPEIIAGPQFDHIGTICQCFETLESGVDNEKQLFFYDNAELETQKKNLLLSLLLQRPLNSQAGSRCRLFCEKTPVNICYFKKLYELFPDAHYVMMVRDPRGIISSMIDVSRRAHQQGRRESVDHLIFNNIREVLVRFEACRQFENQYPGVLQYIYYEDLVKSPEVTVRELCTLLQLEFVPEMLQTECSNENSKLVQRDQIWYTEYMYDRPIDPHVAERWKQNLTRSESKVIENSFAVKVFPFLEDYRLQPMNHFEKSINYLAAGYGLHFGRGVGNRFRYALQAFLGLTLK